MKLRFWESQSAKHASVEEDQDTFRGLITRYGQEDREEKRAAERQQNIEQQSQDLQEIFDLGRLLIPRGERSCRFPLSFGERQLLVNVGDFYDGPRNASTGMDKNIRVVVYEGGKDKVHDLVLSQYDGKGRWQVQYGTHHNPDPERYWTATDEGNYHLLGSVYDNLHEQVSDVLNILVHRAKDTVEHRPVHNVA